MELRIVLIVLLATLYSCKHNKSQIEKKEEVKPSIIVEKSLEKKNDYGKTVTYLKLNESNRTGDVFLYEDFFVELVFNIDEQASYLLISKNQKIKKFKLNDDFDLGEFYMWVYKGDNDFIFLLELDDYYDSIFYTYYYSEDCFLRLKDFSMPQPNVEEEGVKLESFKIKKEGDLFKIKAFLDKNNISNLEVKLNMEECILSK